MIQCKYTGKVLKIQVSSVLYLMFDTNSSQHFHKNLTFATCIFHVAGISYSLLALTAKEC